MKFGLAAGAACLACQMFVAVPVFAAQNTNSSSHSNSNSTWNAPNNSSNATQSNANTQANSNNWQNNSNDQSNTHLNSTDKQLNQMAANLFRDIHNAETALSNNSKSNAQADVKQALNDWQRMSSLENANGAVVVPLYAELDETQTLAPMTMQHRENNNNEDAAQNRYAPVTVDQASGQFTFVGLDLNKAKKDLDAAETAINNGNMEAAQASLQAVGDKLVTTTVQSDFPLLAARENLGIAESAVKNGREREAKAALKEASKDLDSYANGSQNHAQDAKDLGNNIRSFSQNLNQGNSQAANKIDGWWNQVNGWFGSQPNNASTGNS